MRLDDYLSPLPFCAVLRGITPPEIADVADALVGEGFRILEVPLNSPQPFESIGALAKRCGEHVLVGAGTVLQVDDVARVRDAGGKLIVMPHGDVAIVREAKRLGLVCMPGVATPTEAFAALAAGADALKMFPCEALPPADTARLRTLVQRAGIFSKSHGKKSAPPAPDARAYTIAVDDGGQCRTLTVTEPITDDALRDLIAELRAHADALRGRR